MPVCVQTCASTTALQLIWENFHYSKMKPHTLEPSHSSSSFPLSLRQLLSFIYLSIYLAIIYHLSIIYVSIICLSIYHLSGTGSLYVTQASFELTFFFSVLVLEFKVCTLSHSTSPFFCNGFFEIGSHKLFAQGWLQTLILLISASWVAGITGMSTAASAFWVLGLQVCTTTPGLHSSLLLDNIPLYKWVYHILFTH
jgi:hypothetical protein